MTDPPTTYTLHGEMAPVEALELAITIMEEKAEPDRLLVKMIELHPGAGADRHALHRYRRYLKAIDRLKAIKRDYQNQITREEKT